MGFGSDMHNSNNNLKISKLKNYFLADIITIRQNGS